MDKDDINEFLDDMRRQRDELRLQIHLAKAEAKDKWDELEKQWGEFETKAAAAGKAAGESSGDIADAARKLGQEIKKGYEHIRKAI